MAPRRLPPKVMGRSSKRQRKSAPERPWYLHASWLLPILACVAFAVLIAGIVGGRQLIVLVQGDENAEVQKVDDPAGDEVAVPFNTADGEPSEAADEVASLESSQLGVQVLPPKAAIKTGRTLPRLLLVGRREGMFPRLEDAIALVIPGDIIEIRQNLPLVVIPAKCEVERRTLGALPLTIRAGKGFRPVLRVKGGSDAAISIVNMDVNLTGLHFTSSNPGTIIAANDSDVVVKGCSFTQLPPQGGLALAVQNSDDGKKSIKVTIENCFFRRMGTLSCTGPAIDVAIDESGLVYSGNRALVMGHEEDHSLRIHNSTIINTYLIHVQMRQHDQRLTKPLSFEMDHSLFGILACCPVLVDVQFSPQYLTNQPERQIGALRDIFSRFNAQSSIAQFWGAWASIRGIGMVGERVFPEMPTIDDTVRFGKTIEEMRLLIHKAGQMEKAMGLAATVLPVDLVPISTGPLAERISAGERYGCDVTKLPIPPASTLQAYTTLAGD